MSVAISQPRAPKSRSSVIAIFVAFTLLFLAYVDLYLVFDDRAFRTVARSFWNIYNGTYLAFFGAVVAVLATAVCVVLLSLRSESVDVPNKRTVASAIVGVALLSIVAWLLFFTVHGFIISVVAVLTTFGIVLASGILAFRNTSASYRYALIPAILTVVCMIAVLVLTILSYLTLNTVSPGLFRANSIELFIVLAIMGISTLLATVYLIRNLFP